MAKLSNYTEDPQWSFVREGGPLQQASLRPCAFHRSYTRGLYDVGPSLDVTRLVAELIADSSEGPTGEVIRSKCLGLTLIVAPDQKSALGLVENLARFHGVTVHLATEFSAEANQSLDRLNDTIVGTSFQIQELFQTARATKPRVIFFEARVACRQSQQQFLKFIPPESEVYGIIRSFHRQPETEQALLQDFYGPHRCRLLHHDRFARPVAVEAVVRRLTNQPPRPDRTLDRLARTTWINDCLIDAKARLSWIGRQITGHVGVRRNDGDGPGRRSEVEPRIDSSCVIARDEEQLAKLLSRLPSLFVGVVRNAASFGNRHPALKNRVVNKQGTAVDGSITPIDHRSHLVIAREQVPWAGYRSVWFRADAQSLPIPFSSLQLTTGRLSERTTLVDFADQKPPELERAAKRRFAGYYGSEFDLTNAAIFSNEQLEKLNKQRPPRELTTQYESKRPSYRTVSLDNRPSARARRKTESLRKKNKQLLVGEFAATDALIAEFIAHQQDRQHGQAAGIDDVRATDLSREDINYNAVELGNRLRNSNWYPAKERRVEIPKLRGGTRTIGIPTIADRAVLSSLARAVRHWWTPRTQGACYSSPGAGQWPMLLKIRATLQTLHDTPGSHAVLACLDIQDAFGSCEPLLVLSALDEREVFREPAISCPEFAFYQGQPLDAVRQRDAARLAVERALRGAENRNRGLSQGNALSPLALEIVLDQFVITDLERVLRPRNEHQFWYVDDAAICCPSVQSAGNRVEQVRTLLGERLGMLPRDAEQHVFDLTAGEEARILGMGVRISEGKVTFGIPSDAIDRLYTTTQIHRRQGDTQAARLLTRSWIEHYAPVLDANDANESETALTWRKIHKATRHIANHGQLRSWVKKSVSHLRARFPQEPSPSGGTTLAGNGPFLDFQEQARALELIP